MRNSLQGFLYYISHLKESAAFLTECKVNHLVGSINNTSGISAHANSLISHVKAAKLIVVGTLEGQVLHLPPIQTGEAALQTLRIRKSQLNGHTHSEAQYHFGMEMEATFIQPPDGLDDWGHDIIFEFAGDDDMWLYVDGELILDLGGIHSALVGKINFSTGEVLIPSTTESSGNSAISVPTTLRALVKENYWGRNPEMSEADVEAYLDTVFKPGTSVFPDYSSHTMKMFYMERGASMSNLYMRFNLTTATDGQLLLEKTVSGTDKQEYSNARFAYQIWYFDKEYNEWRTVSRTEVPGEGDEVTYEYTGASSVNYVGTTTPVEYQSSYENLYNNVFFLTPGQMADIRFPDDTTEYFVRECYIDTSIYDTVHANNVLLTGTPVDPNDPVFQDFQTQPEVIGKRKALSAGLPRRPTSRRCLSWGRRLQGVQRSF